MQQISVDFRIQYGLAVSLMCLLVVLLKANFKHTNFNLSCKSFLIVN